MLGELSKTSGTQQAVERYDSGLLSSSGLGMKQFRNLGDTLVRPCEPRLYQNDHGLRGPVWTSFVGS